MNRSAILIYYYCNKKISSRRYQCHSADATTHGRWSGFTIPVERVTAQYDIEHGNPLKKQHKTFKII